MDIVKLRLLSSVLVNPDEGLRPARRVRQTSDYKPAPEEPVLAPSGNLRKEWKVIQASVAFGGRITSQVSSFPA